MGWRLGCPEECEKTSRLSPKIRSRIAFTYPRDEWFVHAAVALENARYRLRRDPFRAFVHRSERMASVLESAGFVRAAGSAKSEWALDLHRRLS
jgi:hypothetical protein